MERGWWRRFAVFVFFTGLSLYYVYPTLAGLDLEKTNYPFKKKINLGLDLQGGLYIVMSVDFNAVLKETVERRGSNLEGRLKEKGLTLQKITFLKEGLPEDDTRFQIEFLADHREAIHKLIKEEYWSLRITEESPGRMQLGLSREYRSDVREKTLSQSIEVIRNRIDEFGISEPTITSQGNERVVVELPGVKDVDRAKSLIGQTAKLEFKIVNDEAMSPPEVADLVAKIETENKIKYVETESFSAYIKKLNELAKGKIPEETEISFEREKGPGGETLQRIPYLLKSKVEVSGEDLDDARVDYNNDQRRPQVAFSLNPRGASSFETLTGANIGKRLAIVLDNIVVSAPTIQARISSNGVITLGRGNMDQVDREAKDLAIVLRAGALPAQLTLAEQRVVGPTLGSDSIKKGVFSGLVGALLVFAFTIFYYRMSGVIAVTSLILNILFMLAVLIGFDAVLTLPGIAGIALTVGIAVDSNVVIYERIREEIRAGKSLHGSVDAGFQKAFRTIMDANITNAAAAVILMMYGTGPIKGFAITLIIGIITTLFSANFFCKMVFSWYLSRLEGKPATAISI